MRNGGDDSERFTAGRSIEEPPRDDGDDRTSDDLDDARSARVAEASRGPKSRVKRPSTKPSAKSEDRKTLVSALSPEERSPEMPSRLAGAKPAEPKPVPEKKAAPKKAKSRSAGPRSKRAPRSKAQPPQARRDSAPETSRAPISFDPKTTLIDDPAQKRAIHAVRASVPPSARASVRVEREDEISIPPSGDLTEHDERFFAEGEILSRPPPPEPFHAVRIAGRATTASEDFEARQASTVIPPERRKKLTNYVKLAVGFSAVLCLAALTRVGVSRVGHPMSEGSAAAAQIVTVAPAAMAPAPPVAEPQPVAAAPVPEVAAPPVADPAPPAKSAKEEKEDARKALERGKLKDAVEAGQRSVALDGTDAEAWLILGSAEQELGHGKSAREAFVQCTKEAKSGPVRECSLMLR